MSLQSRHVYTHDERRILEASFAHQSHPSLCEKERLAKLLNCNIIQISNWFQNHRRGIKKQKKSIALRTSTIMNSTTMNSPVYQRSYAYHQPNCPFNIYNENTSYYYYYPTPQPPSQYTYVPDSFCTQTMFVDPFITYEQ